MRLLPARGWIVAALFTAPAAVMAQVGSTDAWYLWAGAGRTANWHATAVQRIAPRSLSDAASGDSTPIIKEVHAHAATIASLALGRRWGVSARDAISGEVEVSSSHHRFDVRGIAIGAATSPGTGVSQAEPTGGAGAPGYAILFGSSTTDVSHLVNAGWTRSLTSRYQVSLFGGIGRNTSAAVESATAWQLKSELRAALSERCSISLTAKYLHVRDYRFKAGELRAPFPYDIGAVDTISALIGVRWKL